jgi:hypothetical protein
MYINALFKKVGVGDWDFACLMLKDNSTRKIKYVRVNKFLSMDNNNSAGSSKIFPFVMLGLLFMY